MSRRWLKSEPIFTEKFENVDKKNGIIYGVRMVSMGEAKGHGVQLNSAFIDKTVQLAQAQTNGVKARFGHPNMCNESLGKYLGVYKNVRRVDDSAVGDLYLSDTAKRTPNGDLYEYVMTMAQDEPESFGSSIVFEGGEFEGEQNGKKVWFATIDTLEFTDLVGEPAATNGLFTNRSLSEMVTEFLEDNPKIFEAYEKDPKVLQIFLNKYKMFKLKKNDRKSVLKFAKFKTGEQIAFYGELQEGTEIEPVELETLPDDDYTLDDGRVISVKGGAITAVKDPVPADPEMEEAMSAMTEAVVASVGEMFTALEAKFTALKLDFDALKKTGSKGTVDKKQPVQNSKGQGFDVHAIIRNKVKENFANLKKKREG